jgi:hypothetical protein
MGATRAVTIESVLIIRCVDSLALSESDSARLGMPLALLNEELGWVYVRIDSA